MDLRQLRYFIATAEELHFGRAAERMHIAQPALSIQIKALEDTLGVRLLARTNRVVALTEAGRLFLKEARRTLEQAEHAAVVARRAGRGEMGHIDIGYDSNGAYSGVLSTTIRHYRRHAPDVELGLHEIHPEAQVTGVLEGRIHVGFVTRPTQGLPQELDAIRLAEWPLRVALPADHPLAERSRVPREALTDEPFIGFTKSAGENYEPLVKELMGFTPHMAYQADGAFALISLVGAGLGVAVVPSSISTINVGESVVYRPIVGVKELIGIDLVFRRDEEDPAVTNFLDIVRRDGR
jgi:DNA-binding transcriptional LysR family regulator